VTSRDVPAPRDDRELPAGSVSGRQDERVSTDIPLEASWTRITTWLQAHAPTTAAALHPPASVQDVARAEESTGVVWPQQLRTWFGLHDGWDRNAWASVLPGWSSPMSLSRSLEERQIWLEVWDDVAADDEEIVERRTEAMGQQAGEVAGVFLPSFVPLDEDQSGEALFVYCRPGLRQGCVTHWMKHDFDYYGLGWWSIGEMLSDVADHLEQQTPCRYWRPQVQDGSLSWVLDEDLGSDSRCLARVSQW
jgi:cell wall assembly regulator SMI1